MEQNYLNLLKEILENGDDMPNRTGVDTRSIFGTQTRYDLRQGFPIITTKKMAIRAVVSELLWFIEGSGDERRLCEILHGTRDASKRTIWTDNANADYWRGGSYAGDLGRVYGVQWRSWRVFAKCSKPEGQETQVGRYRYVDQLAELIDGIENNPTSRRHILTAWNPGELDEMALPPCHLLSQFRVKPYSFEKRMNMMRKQYPTACPDNNGYVCKESMLDIYRIPRGELSCQMYQRSADMFLGVPFNIMSYSLLLAMIAHVTNYVATDFIHTIGDAHIYNTHFDAVRTQLKRQPSRLPKLILNEKVKNINDFTMNDVSIEDYLFYPAIPAPMAV